MDIIFVRRKRSRYYSIINRTLYTHTRMVEQNTRKNSRSFILKLKLDMFPYDNVMLLK